MLWMTGLIGTAAIGYDAVRNVRRYGYLATSRPRYYFELGRATLALAFLLVAPALTIAFLVPNINVLGNNFVSLRRFLMFLAALFCLFAVCGYLCFLCDEGGHVVDAPMNAYRGSFVSWAGFF